MGATLDKEEEDDSSEPTVLETQTGSNLLNPRGEHVDIHDVQIGCSQHVHVEPGAHVIIDQSGKLKKNNPTGTPEDYALIQEKLKEWYKDLKLPMVSWMKGGSTNLLIGNYFIKLHLNVTQQTEGLPIDLQNVFDDVRGTTPTRILIDSQPGFGKTTLAHKIINDWVNGEDYVNHFDFAVLVTLRSLKNKSVEEAGNEITKLDSNEDLDSWKVINNGKTLLVLDGLDEVGDENRENILKILYDTFNNKMVIIVTCRTGLFKLDDENVDFVFGGAAKGDKFWQKKITILGITDENRGEFLDKFIQVENKDQIIQRIEEIIKPVNEMFKSPLLLILLVFVTRKSQNVEIKNQIDLFKNLIICIIRRSARKIQKNLKPNFTIFDEMSPENNEYFNLFYNFGKIAKDHIVNDDLQFECNEETDSIYRMGFFIRHETQQIFEVLTHYEVFHLSVLEFVTAFFMWQEFLKNGKELPNDTLLNVKEICRKKGSTSLVLPFLFGLIGKDVKRIFNQLSQYYSMYSVNSGLMDIIFSECELSDDMNDVISKFVPLSLNASDSSSVFTNNAVFNKILVKLVVRSSDLQCLTQRLNVKIFELILDGWRNVKNFDHIVNNIKCKHLILIHKAEYVNYESMAKHLKMFVAMSTEYRHIHITRLATFGVVLECINDGILDATVVDFLCCEVPEDPVTTETFASVLANIKCKHLSINLCSSLDDLEIIISVVATSSTINSIFLLNCTGKLIELDFNSIVDNGYKNWELLKLFGFCVIQSDESVFSRDCACDIECGTLDSADMLRAISPRSLRCPGEFLYAVICKPNASSWYGWDSTVELTLNCDSRMLLKPLDFAQLRRFKRLEVVVIRLLDCSTFLNHYIVNSLRKLNVDKVEIEWMDKFGDELSSLIRSIDDLIKTGKLLKSVRNIDLVLCDKHNTQIDLDLCAKPNTQNSQKSNYVFDINPLISILDYSSKIRARFVFENTNATSIFFEKNCINFSKFSVECEIGDHCKPLKGYNFFGVFLSNYYVLTIQKKL